MAEKREQDTWLVRVRRTENPGLTLVCLGFCGGGTASYHQWADAVPAGLGVAAVCYPGREGRYAEPFAKDWDALVLDTTVAVLRAAAEGPYVLYGHSMGGWMAFDVAVRIAATAGAPSPRALVVSSTNAPSRGLTRRDMFLAAHHTDRQLLAWMDTHGLLPEHVRADPDLSAMALELMRADIRVRDTFHYVPGSVVQVPLQVLTGADDEVIEPDAEQSWAKLAQAGYEYRVLPGGHFFTPEVWRRLPTRFSALPQLVR